MCPSYTATAKAFNDDGTLLHTAICTSEDDERFATIMAVEAVQEHPEGQYWSKMVVEIECDR